MARVFALCAPLSRGHFAMPANGDKRQSALTIQHTTLSANGVERSVIWYPQGITEAVTI